MYSIARILTVYSIAHILTVYSVTRILTVYSITHILTVYSITRTLTVYSVTRILPKFLYFRFFRTVNSCTLPLFMSLCYKVLLTSRKLFDDELAEWLSVCQELLHVFTCLVTIFHPLLCCNCGRRTFLANLHIMAWQQSVIRLGLHVMDEVRNVHLHVAELLELHHFYYK